MGERQQKTQDATQIMTRTTRIADTIIYQIEHGEGAAGVISTWSVPYSALLRRGVVEEVESDRRPVLLELTLKVGDVQRALELPGSDEQSRWQLVWDQAMRHCEVELLALFASDAVTKYWDRTERMAA